MYSFTYIVLSVKIFVLRLIHCPLASTESIVAEFQPDRVATVDSYMKFKHEIVDMYEISSCFRANFEQLRQGMPILNYATETYDSELALYIEDIGKFDLSCCQNAYIFRIDFNMQLLKWTSICFSMDFASQEYTLVVDGQTIAKNTKVVFPNITNPRVAAGGLLYLGQDQDTLGGTFNPFQSIRGKLADLYLLSTVLSESEMIDFTTCRNYSLRNRSILNLWNASNDFEIQNVNLYVEGKENLCKPDQGRIVILNELQNHDEAIRTCKIIRGSLYVPEDEESNDMLFNLSISQESESSTASKDILWLGAIWDEESGDIINVNTKQPLKYINFWTSVNPFTSVDYCLSFYGTLDTDPKWYRLWDHGRCEKEKYAPCHFENTKFLSMRGLCKKSYFDRNYYVIKENKRLVFLGSKYSAIYEYPPDYSKPNDYGYWEIRRYDMPHVRAHAKKNSIADMPIGKHVWNISNDRCGVTERELVLTSCYPGEFSCADGSCIPLERRCDLETNCTDASDEDDCSPLVLPPNYSSKISPPRDSQTMPVLIDIFVDIHSVKSYELDKFSIVTESTITTTWLDKRIKFKNLKITNTLNNLDYLGVHPWYPEFQYVGGGNTTSDVQDRQFHLLAEKLSNPLPDDDQNSKEDEIFLGSQNPLLMRKKVTTRTICPFDLAFFPYDIQRCDIMSETTVNYAVFQLREDSVKFTGERRLLEYFVTSVTNKTFVLDLASAVKIEMVFENLFIYYMTSAYVPTLIMIIIGGSCLFFPIENFNERSMVSLTSLLVEATLFSQVSASIPKTAYLKFIDTWFLFCILDLFMVNIGLTIINYIYFSAEEGVHSNPQPRVSSIFKSFVVLQDRTWSRKKLAVSLNKWLQVIFIVSLLVFLAVYVFLAMQHRNLL